MLINAFDSDADGKLSLFDLTKLLCPISYMGKAKSSKKNFVYALDNSRIQLSHDIEIGITRVFEKEIASVKSVEPLKQELMSYNDYSLIEIFRAIDQFAHGKINVDNLRVFFLDFDFCSDLEEEDLMNWLRRYDRDADMGLDYFDFARSLGPYCNYN